MGYLKKSVDLKNKKTLTVIIGALLLFIAIPLTVIGTLQLKEGTPHLKTEAAVPPIESMPFPRVLNFRYLMDSSFDGANDEEIKTKIRNSDFGKFSGMVVDGGIAKNSHKAELFKEVYPEKLALLYFWSTSRNKIINNPRQYDFSPKINNPNGTSQIWPGYWLLMNCATLDQAINNTDETTTIPLTRCPDPDNPSSDLPFTADAVSKTYDDAMIWEPDPDGGGPFGRNPKVEYVHVTDVSQADRTITVQRAAWGEGSRSTKTKEFSAGAKIATIADTGGGGGDGWGYNHSTMAPVNPNNNMKANEWLADWLVDNFPVALDGYQFDSANWFPPVAGRNGEVKNMDCNDDGYIDYCNSDIGTDHQISSYGLGYDEFVHRVRNRLSPDKLVLSDDNYRGVDVINGAELETFPYGNEYDRSSSSLSSLEFFTTRSQQPNATYTYTKEETEKYPGKLDPDTLVGTNKRNRFGLVASLLFGSFHTYISMPFGVWDYYGWDEDGGVVNTALPPDGTGLDTGYLGQIKGNQPTRIFRYDQVDPDNQISNSSFESVPYDSGWLLNVITSDDGNPNNDFGGNKIQEAEAPPDPTLGSHSLMVNVTRIAADPFATGVSLRYPGLNVDSGSEYTAVFWAKANGVREITLALKKPGGQPLSEEENQIKLDSTWREFYINLETKNSLPESAVLEFRLGKEIGSYSFDGVEFKKGTAEILTREFDHGIAILNGSIFPQTINLEGNYVRINGRQERGYDFGGNHYIVNDGSPVEGSVTLGPKDAIILLKAPSSPKVGDIEPPGGDGDVDINDLSTLISNWGATSGAADINGDHKVDVFDLSILLSNWGS